MAISLAAYKTLGSIDSLISRLGFLELNEFLTQDEKNAYLRISQNDDWINHSSTVTRKKSVLHFMPCKYKDFERVALMKMEPNAIQDWHTDGNRTTVLIYPLSDNYAPGETRNGKYHGPALVDVTKEHAVFNNDHTRINLQIGFNERIEKVWDLLQN